MFLGNLIEAILQILLRKKPGGGGKLQRYDRKGQYR
jgi:hypothetical protein